MYTEESIYLFYHKIQIVASNQELCHSSHNFGWVEGDYLGLDAPLGRSTDKSPFHIGQYERQYNKTFPYHMLFGEDIIYWDHKQMQVVLVLSGPAGP